MLACLECRGGREMAKIVKITEDEKTRTLEVCLDEVCKPEEEEHIATRHRVYSWGADLKYDENTQRFYYDFAMTLDRMISEVKLLVQHELEQEKKAVKVYSEQEITQIERTI